MTDVLDSYGYYSDSDVEVVSEAICHPSVSEKLRTIGVILVVGVLAIIGICVFTAFLMAGSITDSGKSAKYLSER